MAREGSLQNFLSMHVRRQRTLQALGFEFDGERAEWLRWYEELMSSTEASMLGTGRGIDFYLYNWCCCSATGPAQHAALLQRFVQGTAVSAAPAH